MACECRHSSATDNLTGSQLRAMDSAELARLGEDSLRSHLVDTAILAHRLHFPLAGPGLEGFLGDRKFVRYPVRLRFGIGNMASHQFANPEESEDGYVLNVHPALEEREGDLPLAVAYFVPLLNYGSFINDDHCLVYGATLNGLTIAEYYQELCRIAALAGAAPRDRD